MQCRQAEERVQDLLDARTPLDSDVVLQRHLAGCEECRERAEVYRQVIGMFAPRGRVRMSSSGRNGLDQQRWARFPVPAALAAALAGLALWLLQGDVGQKRTQIVALAIPPSAAQVASGTVAPNDLVATDAQLQCMGTLAWVAANSVNATLLNVGPMPSSTRLWMEPVSESLRPLTRSVEAAFGAMRATVLGPDPGARS